jgi:hypothetical protein
MDPMSHSFGGHALDRYVFEFEPTDGPDAPVAAVAPSEPAAAPPGGAPEPVPPAGATDTAAASFTPEQIAALRDNPDMQEWLGTEAATIAEARINQVLEQARNGQQTPPQGVPQGGININEFLDPMGDNFGQNLLTVLGMLSQGVNQSVSGALAPFQQQAEAVEAAERDELLSTAITDVASSLGGLRGGDAAVQRVMQSVRGQFMPEAMRMYGHTDRAAQVAIDRAVRAEHAYQTSVAGGAAAATAEHLALVNGAPAAIGNGITGGVVTPINGEVLRGPQIVQKYGAMAAAISGR